MLQQIISMTCGVDILVNNAVLRPMRDWSSPVSQFAENMKVNTTGLFAMTRTFGEHMAARDKGTIVNVGSIHGVIGPDFSLYESLDWSIAPDYFIHRGGLLQLPRFAAAKLGPRGVRVNAIMPGGLYNNQEPQFVERYNARAFLGSRTGDVPGPIVW
jgi:NAD(P)-dependent dehydrogenase (short-subunit alcohol dehydrogenase family)